MMYVFCDSCPFDIATTRANATHLGQAHMDENPGHHVFESDSPE